MNVSETDMSLFYSNESTVHKDFKFIANQIYVLRKKKKRKAPKVQFDIKTFKSGSKKNL